MQIKDDGEIQPTLTGPDVADIARPFLIGPFCREVAVQQVGAGSILNFVYLVWPMRVSDTVTH